jgi:acyl-CoA reductase-like NAD-dependent aldehyde dehydrogenase
MSMIAVNPATGEKVQEYPHTPDSDVTPGMPAYSEELFGPVAPVIQEFVNIKTV